MKKKVLSTIAVATAVFSNLYANSFESEEDLKIVKGNNISISNDYYLYGKNSLKWEAKPNSQIELDLPKDKNDRREFSFVIFQEKAAPNEQLQFIVGDAKRKKEYSISYNLNFENWRVARCSPWEDISAVNNPNSKDTITIVYNGKEDKTFYIDAFNPQSTWLRTPNFQMPYINPKRHTMNSNIPGNELMKNMFSTIESWKNAPAPTAKELKELALIESRLDDWIKPYSENLDNSFKKDLAKNAKIEIERGLNNYKKINLKKRGNSWDFNSGQEPVFAKDTTLNGEASYIVSAFAHALTTKYDYAGKENYSEEEISNKLLDFIDWMNYAGYTLGNDHDWGEIFSVRHMGKSAYLLKDELAKHDPNFKFQWAILWYSRFVGHAVALEYAKVPNADLVRTTFPESLFAIMSMDKKTANALLKSYGKIVENQLKITGGDADFLKEDGSLFHHGQAANMYYGPTALFGAIFMAKMLDNTEYELSDQSIKNIRKGIVSLYQQQHKLDTPAATNVRWAFDSNGAASLIPTVAMYLSMRPDDKEVIQIFKNIYDKERVAIQFSSTSPLPFSEGAVSMVERIAKHYENVQKTTESTMAIPFNLSALLIYRHQDYLASVRGFGKHAWAFEIGTYNANGYDNRNARFVSHGALQLFVPNKNAKEGGYTDSGWDFNHFPGTTNLSLDSKNLEIPRYLKYGRSYTTSRLAGAGVLNEKYGIYGLELIDPQFKSFHAFKSWHFVDNVIVALGSGITNNEKDFDTVTTLFQTQIADNAKAEEFNKVLSENIILTDINNVKYHVKAGQNVKYTKSKQSGMNVVNKAKVSGVYEKAYFDHGKAPKDGKYEYAIELTTDNKADLNYEVLAQTSNLHAVYFVNKKLLSMAILGVDEKLPAKSPIAFSSEPILLQIQEIEKDKYLVSVTHTDYYLKNWEEPNDIMLSGIDFYPEPTDLTLVLNGNWKSSDSKVNINNGKLNIKVKVGTPQEFILQKASIKN